MVEIDNNWAENVMRPIAHGCQNCMQFGSKNAGSKIAATLSVLETCKKLWVNRREYPLEVLLQLSYRAPHPSLQRLAALEKLTPGAWQRLHAKRKDTLP